MGVRGEPLHYRSMKLRPYQRKGVSAVRRAFSSGHQGVLVVSPTGSGKTFFTGLGLILPAAANNKRVIFCVHLREVVDAASRVLTELGVPHGVIMAGRNPDPSAPVQVISIQTVTARGSYPPADLVIIDEAHRAAAGQYKKLVERYPRAKILGLTATPIRTDGQPLCPPSAPFTELVELVTPPELVEDGFLVDVEAYGADAPDVEELRIDPKTKDYDRSQAGKLYTSTPKLVADPVDEWLARARGLRTIAFACNRTHGRALEEAYLRRGVRAAYVDGTTSLRTRKETLRKLRFHELDVLVNIDVFTEGWDEPLLGCVQLVRPTASLARYIQAAGRGLRPITDKERRWCRENDLPVPRKERVVLLDHGANLNRHGFPTDARDWALDPKDESPFASFGMGNGRGHGGSRMQMWTCSKCGRANPLRVMRCSCGAPPAADVLPLLLESRLIRLNRGEFLQLGS